MLSKFTNLYFPICSLATTILLLILFFTKKNAKNVETKIYTKLIIVGFIEAFTYSFICFIAHFIDINTYILLYEILNKFIYIIYIIWFALLYNYEIKISFNGLKKELANMFMYILYGIEIIISLAIILLPVQIYFDAKTGLSNSFGMSANALFIGIGLYIFSILAVAVVNFKNIKSKKYTPMFILIIFMIITMIIRVVDPLFSIYSNILSLVTLVMYFTIENPDVKMAKELAFQKEISEAASKKTIELINDMSSDLKSSINKLQTFGTKKIDKNNMDELSKELTEFQNESIILSDKISGVLDLALIKGDTETKEYKYETYDMLDKLKELLIVEQESDTKLSIDIHDQFPSVLYGDEDNVIKIVIYFYNLISSIKKDKISLNIDSMNVGRFLRLRFKFEIGNTSIDEYIYKNNDTKELEFRKENDLNFKVVEKLLKKFNGKITVSENHKLITLSINQRLMTEYEIISNRKENKDIKIDYHNFSGKRVLIVDDNKLKVKELKILLKPYKLDVYDATSPIEVADILDKNVTFDLVIIDDIISNYTLDEFTSEIIKPKEDVLRYIKDAKYPISAIIMVTPNTKNMEQKYLDYGFSDYIIKPINKENLDKVLLKNLKK